MTACTRSVPPPPQPLVQIRRGYITEYGHLRLSVESEGSGWTSQVREGNDGPTLYSACRCNLEAAKEAATEFAVFRGTGKIGWNGPQAKLRGLPWSECW